MKFASSRRIPPDEWWPHGVRGVTSSHIALRTGVTVRSVSAGPEDAPPVVLIHGLGIHAHLWRRTVPALVDAGRRVYALDLPGHGLSDRPLEPGSYTLAKMTDHVAAYCDAIGVARAVVVAQSMGGRIAIELAYRGPKRVSGLALYGSVGFGVAPRALPLVPRLPAPRGALSALLTQRWMVAIGKGFAYGRRARVAQADIDAYWATTQFPDFVPAVRQALIDFDWRELTPDQCAALRVPTLIVFGTRDRTIRPLHAERLCAAVPDARLVWVHDAGHVVPEEVADESNAHLLEFISRTG
ncbi:MAG TPA: alpha/beta fold hydrolase [Gemmatimonadaceae bacterium]|nr:alpha/beta fold hydrolase [Gemmatimonadaceae bacterium]